MHTVHCMPAVDSPSAHHLPTALRHTASAACPLPIVSVLLNGCLSIAHHIRTHCPSSANSPPSQRQSLAACQQPCPLFPISSPVNMPLFECICQQKIHRLDALPLPLPTDHHSIACQLLSLARSFDADGLLLRTNPVSQCPLTVNCQLPSHRDSWCCFPSPAPSSQEPDPIPRQYLALRMAHSLGALRLNPHFFL